MDLFLNLPLEIKSEIFKYVPLKHYQKLALICKCIRIALHHDYIWLFVCKRKKITINNVNYLETVKNYQLYHWKWDSNKKSKDIDIVDERKTMITRADCVRSNPLIQTKRPFGRIRKRFRVKILELKGWLSVGLADVSVVKDEDSVVGHQMNCINAGYYVEPALSQGWIVSKRERIKKVMFYEGDEIEIVILDQTIIFKRNSLPVAALIHDERFEVYPTVSLSRRSKVMIIND